MIGFLNLWRLFVAFSVILTLVTGLASILGATLSVQLIWATGFLIIALILLGLVIPPYEALALSNVVELKLSEQGKKAQSRSEFSYVPLLSRISHQI